MSDLPSPSAVRPALADSKWFADEVHPHEASLRAYVRGAFPSVRDVDDVVQESLLRVWQARTAQTIRSARGFLFSIARHLALDQVRRDRVSPIVRLGDFCAENVLNDGADTVAVVSAQEKAEALGRAIGSLPARCREIIILRKLHEVSTADIAARLCISEKTVEAQITRGVKLCAQRLRAEGFTRYGDL